MLFCIVTVRNGSCGKVMFSQACTIPSVHRGTCVAKGSMHGEGGHAWQRGVCMAKGGVSGKGGMCGRWACVAGEHA